MRSTAAQAWRRHHNASHVPVLLPIGIQEILFRPLRTAMLVRGIDLHGNFDDEPRPRVDFGDPERAVHADAVAGKEHAFRRRPFYDPTEVLANAK
jgi:hypothetical protein